MLSFLAFTWDIVFLNPAGKAWRVRPPSHFQFQWIIAQYIAQYIAHYVAHYVAHQYVPVALLYSDVWN